MTIEDVGYSRIGGRRIVDVENDSLGGGEAAERQKVQVARFGSMERAFSYADARAAVAELSMLIGDEDYGDHLLERLREALDVLAKPRPIRNQSTGGRT